MALALKEASASAAPGRHRLYEHDCYDAANDDVDNCSDAEQAQTTLLMDSSSGCDDDSDCLRTKWRSETLSC